MMLFRRILLLILLNNFLEDDEMKTCPNCNTTLQENDRFCPACGIAVATEPQPTQQQTAGRQAAPQQPPERAAVCIRFSVVQGDLASLS